MHLMFFSEVLSGSLSAPVFSLRCLLKILAKRTFELEASWDTQEILLSVSTLTICVTSGKSLNLL